MRKLALLFILALPACVSPSTIEPLRPYEIATSLYLEGGQEQVVGSLMYEGGCLLFDPENGPPRVLPVWPAGTRFEESLVTFHQPAKSEQRVAIGEEIRLDGRAEQWSRLDPQVYQRFEHQCGAKPFFVSGLAPAN